MEIDVTKLVAAFVAEEPAAMDCSGSRMEHGCNAAAFTWGNACELADDQVVLTDDQVEAVRDYFLGFGAWERDELDDDTVAGLLVQEVASECRRLSEHEGLDLSSCTGGDVQRASECEGGHLWPSGGRWYLYAGF